MAEDDPDHQQVLACFLRGTDADEVVVGGNGQIAFDKALASVQEACPFAVILIDIRMPVMDGYEATAQIRQLPDSRGTGLPIVALTANALSGDEQKCLDAGMNDFLAKPY